MEIENQYRAVLELTNRMVKATENQEWDQLTALEQERAALVALIPPVSRSTMSLTPDLAARIAHLITEIERESSVILEHVHVWQKHVKILLRLDKPAGI
jgi:hypothetical protein